MKEQSPRQELSEYANNGNLRRDLERASGPGLSYQAVDLAVRVVLNYCEPRRSRRKKAAV